MIRIFINVKNRYISFSYTKLFNDTKRTKIIGNKPKHGKTTRNQQQRLAGNSFLPFPDQIGFDNHFINMRNFDWVFKRWLSLFKCLQRQQLSEMLIFDYMTIIVGS